MEHTYDADAAAVTAQAPPSAGKSAVSWAAIIAGAFVAAAVSLVLLALGSGLGFAAVSPWQDRGVSVTSLAVSTAIWLVVMQWLSSGVGGYIAGRLRTRWLGTHTHEVFFRDTAHGFVTWAVATVLVAAILATSALSAAGGGAHALGGAMAGAAHGAAHDMTDPAARGYGVDRLFRAAGPVTSGGGADDPRPEAVRIAANAVAAGGVPDADRGYLAALVAVRAGVPQVEAQKRVDEYIAVEMSAAVKNKADVDMARRAASQAAIYTALSMLVGAFIASVSAALGGRLRDEHP